MLIYCPDCRRKISTDVDRCPGCGCIIDSNRMYEPVEIKRVSPLGIASVALVLAYVPFMIFCIYVFGAFIFEPNLMWVSILAMMIGLWVIPILQVVFGIISLNKRKDSHRLPAIMGIIMGGVGIIIAISFMFVTFQI